MHSDHYKILALILLSVIPLVNCKRNEIQKDSSKVEWVNASELKPGNIKHEQLTNLQIERIKKVKDVFAEIDNSPLDKWIDDFKRDLNPDRELEVWEGMATAYSKYVNGKNLSLEAKKDVFQVILLRSGAPENEVLNHLKLKVLSTDDAKEIMKNY
jgi:hypothetical protein